jgi:hypothetical protein
MLLLLLLLLKKGRTSVSIAFCFYSPPLIDVSCRLSLSPFILI